MRVMILDMNIDPTEYPDSDYEGEQDWLTAKDLAESDFLENQSDMSSNLSFLSSESLDLCQCSVNSCQLSRITPVDSQVLTVFYGQFPFNITLDSGATVSFVL